MEVIRRFENELGFVQIEKYNDCFAVNMHSEEAKVGHFLQYNFKQDAIASFQFYTWWLTENNKH